MASVVGVGNGLGAVHKAIREVADSFGRQRDERQGRRHLDVDDFERLSATGLLRAVVPVEHGGLWQDMRTSARPIADSLRALGAGDPSVALVSAMHPSVIAFWLLSDTNEPAWQAQREAVFATAMAGEQWGTITSEPGSGGDITRTRTAAVPVEGGDSALSGERYRLTGTKHFGSGSGICSYMITTGLPTGADEPAMFALDVREHPWENGTGMSIVAPWDGMGMTATQSHGMQLDDMPAIRLAWTGDIDDLVRPVGPLAACLFTAVVIGILDEATAVARTQITGRRDSLRAYEQTEWARAEMDHWLAVQAYEGALRSLESSSTRVAIHATLRAKESVARLAEETLLRLSRVLGGGTFSQRSPFAHWFEDVRALGFLRPPWGLAFDGLFATSLEESDDSDTVA